MSIDDLTIGDVRQIGAMLGGQQSVCDNGPWKIGQDYLVETVTKYYLGTLVSVGRHELVLRDAAWVAHTGRYHAALESGNLQEVEPIPGDGIAIIGRGAIVSAEEWAHGVQRVVE